MRPDDGRAAQRPPLFDIETFFGDPEFSSASLSPDGTRIAYLQSRTPRVGGVMITVPATWAAPTQVMSPIQRSPSTEAP